MSSLPIPTNIATRMIAFLMPGTFGRIELDVQDGRVVQCRIVDVVKPADELVKLREVRAAHERIG